MAIARPPSRALEQVIKKLTVLQQPPLMLVLRTSEVKLYSFTNLLFNLYVSGAEQALDELLIQKSHVGQWVYKDKFDHQLVSAVCIQIKGDIQYNLGQWGQGAKLLLESLILLRYYKDMFNGYFFLCRV